jgi:sulfofructose kinase
VQLPFRLALEKDFDAVGFGLNAVDHLIVVPAYPAFDTKVRLSEHVRAAGGQVATTLAGLQRLGMRTAYAGRFGADDAGEFGLAELIKEGVNTEFAEVVEGAHNQIAFIIIEGHSGERTIIWDRDERLAYAPREAPTGIASRGRVLHLDAHDPPACVPLAWEARKSGTIVSADIDNIYDGLPELLPLIDVLISSKEFPRRLTGVADARASLIAVKERYGCALVGMTLGARGALLYQEGVFLESPAFAVPGVCRDTTGAGDAFHTGFLYGMLRGAELEACLGFANATAALKCRGLGARTALPTEKELTEFLNGNPATLG